jgi:hypothetical protein
MPRCLARGSSPASRMLQSRRSQSLGRSEQAASDYGAKPAATREQVYQFAWAAIEAGYPEPAAAAVICFEFLQRPENVLAGYLAWPDYRGKDAPNAIKITHHKSGAVIWHPLEEKAEQGTVKFYSDAEAVLARLPRRGVAMILKLRQDGTTEPYDRHEMAKIVRKTRYVILSHAMAHCRRRLRWTPADTAA